MIRSAYLASEGNKAVLAEELARRGAPVERWHGRLALSSAPPVDAFWSLDGWLAPETVPIGSIADAARALRDRQRNWSNYAVEWTGRSKLIVERLPPVKGAALRFPQAAPTAPLGAWTLLAPDTLLLSTRKTSPFPDGQARFVEDREGPPSRAYLKLWEACARAGIWPQPGDRCADLGATPGGWSWAIAQLGASVMAVDRAPLDPRVLAMPGVAFRQESAFGLAPEMLAPPDGPPLDWVFSDIIAYPARLLGLVRRWIDSGRARRIVWTVKFQDPTDHDAADAFAAIPGGRLLHLSHNKHELTFFWNAEG